MTIIRTLLTICLLLVVGKLTAQNENEDVMYGSFKLRKNKTTTCIPDSLINVVAIQAEGKTGRKKGLLKGTISVHNSSYRVIPGSFVGVYRDGNLVGYTLSDNDGKFVVNDLATGKYRLEVCRVGYEFAILKSIEIKAGHTTFTDVQLHGTYQEHIPQNDLPVDSIGSFKIRMRKSETPKAPGSIQGIVSLINNDFPLEKVVIELFQDGKKINSVNCDENGKFALLKLPDGMYEVNIITDRNNNDLIPGVQVNTGKMRVIEVSITRRGKMKRK